MKSLKTMPYHCRRILGQLCSVPSTWIVVLDAGEQHHAKTLVENGLVEIVNAAGIDCWRPTEKGRIHWKEFTCRNILPNVCANEQLALCKFVNHVDILDAKFSTSDLENAKAVADWNHMLWLRNDASELLSTKWAKQ